MTPTAGGIVEDRTGKGLQAAWDELAAPLRRVVLALGLDGHRADDILQEVFLAAHTRGPTDADLAVWRRWLYRVTVNRCHIEYRRHRRWREVLAGWSPRRTVESLDPGKEAQAAEREKLVREALAALPIDERTLLALRYLEGLDSTEMGAILERPASTIRGQLRSARHRLAAELLRKGWDDAQEQ